MYKVPIIYNNRKESGTLAVAANSTKLSVPDEEKEKVYITYNDYGICCVTSTKEAAAQVCIDEGDIDMNTPLHYRENGHHCINPVCIVYGDNWQQQVIEHWDELCGDYPHYYKYSWDFVCEEYEVKP